MLRVAAVVAALVLSAWAAACTGPFRTVRLSGPPSPSASSGPLAADLTLAAPPAPSPSVAPTPNPKPAATMTPAATPARGGRAPAPVPAASPKMVNGILVGSVQQQLTNQARVAAGLAPLTWSGCLADVAARHAMEMATAGRIYHGDGVNRDLACGLGSHQTGENVGVTSVGVDDQRIFDAFMKSSGHRANILGPYRYIGTAWTLGPGGGYVSVEFG
jgi:uncharacterized protein YkwD